MLEFIISFMTSYFFGFNNGIMSFIFLKSILNNNFKLSIFWFINLLTYFFIGPSYILFAKIYLAITGLLLLNNFQFNFDAPIFLKMQKVKEIFNFINILVSLPFYLIFDNINYILIETGIKNKITNNIIYKKYEENLDLIPKLDSGFDFKNMKMPEMPKIPDIEKMMDYSDEELESMLDDMLNPNKFLNMTNDMRKNIGKSELSEKEMIDKINNFQNIFSMFGAPISEMNEISDILKDFDKGKKIKYKNK